MRMNRLKWMMLLLLFAAVFSMPLQPAGAASGLVLGGSPNAPVKIEVFSDFQCPACRELYLDTMRPVIADYCSKNRVYLVYHEFPLSTIHKYSREAARYAEAASRLGRKKLLMVFDSLFMDQEKWSLNGNIEASVAKVLSRAELEKLKAILHEPSIDATIDKEISVANKKGIKGTPTFILSAAGKKTEKADGPLPYPAMKAAIDKLLK
jgi:protein-disulfide isomerase